MGGSAVVWERECTSNALLTGAWHLWNLPHDPLSHHVMLFVVCQLILVVKENAVRLSGMPPKTGYWSKGSWLSCMSDVPSFSKSILGCTIFLKNDFPLFVNEEGPGGRVFPTQKGRKFRVMCQRSSENNYAAMQQWISRKGWGDKLKGSCLCMTVRSCQDLVNKGIEKMAKKSSSLSDCEVTEESRWADCVTSVQSLENGFRMLKLKKGDERWLLLLLLKLQENYLSVHRLGVTYQKHKWSRSKLAILI